MLLPLLADLGLFIGRFHPLLVHLPIGFLLLAVVLEFWPGDGLRPAVRITWALGALAAVAAAGCGWLLAAESGGGDTLFWHRWLGVSVAVLAAVGVFVTRRGGKLAKGYGVVVAALLGLAGHQGGNLTHGEESLFVHAPAVVQDVAGYQPAGAVTTDWSTVDTDSINVYRTFLEPALTATCVRCHNAGKQNGGLRMDEAHHLFVGGDGGPILSPGNALASSWTRRVTLPRANAKAMPPQGKPWDYTTVEVLKYWIDEGADTLAVFDPKTTPEALKALLKRDYGLDLRPKLFVEKVRAPRLPDADLAALRGINWSVNPFTPTGGALEVKVEPGKTVTPAALQTLAAKAADQIVYLSLDDLPFTDADHSPLARFRNLNRLRLNGTGVSRQMVEALARLPHLESLNLYGTGVSDEVWPVLAEFPALKRVYLWQTGVSSQGAAAFAGEAPGVMVSLGVGK